MKRGATHETALARRAGVVDSNLLEAEATRAWPGLKARRRTAAGMTREDGASN